MHSRAGSFSMSSPSSVDDLRGSHQVLRAIRPEIFAIPGDAARIRRTSTRASTFTPRRGATGVPNRVPSQANSAAERAGAHDFESARVGDASAVSAKRSRTASGSRFQASLRGPSAAHAVAVVPRVVASVSAAVCWPGSCALRHSPMTLAMRSPMRIILSSVLRGMRFTASTSASPSRGTRAA